MEMDAPWYIAWRERRRSRLHTVPRMRDEGGLTRPRALVARGEKLTRDGDSDRKKQSDDDDDNNNSNKNKNNDKDKDRKTTTDQTTTLQTTSTTTISAASTTPALSSVAATTSTTPIVVSPASTSSTSIPPLTTSTPQTTPVSIPPTSTTSISTEALSSTSPTIIFSPTTSSSPASASATTVWLISSSVATVTVSTSPSTATAVADTLPSSSPSSTSGRPIVIGQQDKDGDGNGHSNGKHHDRYPPNNNKFAIAFGVIGALGFLVGIVWAVMIIRRRRQRRQRRDDMSNSDYASTIHSHRPSRFQFNLPSLPFNRADRDGSQSTRQFSMPFGSANKRTDSSVMDEAKRSAYGGDTVSVQGYLDEKKHDPNYPLPILEPAPVTQASIRKSVASWFRRSPGNHPLNLNSMSRWSRPTTATRSAAGAADNSQYAAPVYLVPGNGATVIPPMPDLAMQRAYTAGNAVPGAKAGARMSTSTTGTPSNPAELASVYTLDDDDNISIPAATATQPASHWSASTIGSSGAAAAPGERIGSVGSWSSGTRTTMSPDEREPGATGLSPPSYHLGGSNAGGTTTTTTTMTLSEAGAATATGDLTTSLGAGMPPPQGGERLTNLHQELLALYAQGESAAAEEHEGQGKSGTVVGKL